MKAIITVDVPEHQIGQEVSVYFKDTMCVNGTCESEAEVYAKHDEEVIKETVESIWGKPPYIEYIDKLIDKCMETLFDDTLDKIRAEVERFQANCDLSCSDGSNCRTCNNITFGSVYRIIDKYRKGDKE